MSKKAPATIDLMAAFFQSAQADQAPVAATPTPASKRRTQPAKPGRKAKVEKPIVLIGTLRAWKAHRTMLKNALEGTKGKSAHADRVRDELRLRIAKYDRLLEDNAA